MELKLHVVPVVNEGEYNCIFGQSHFIKTVEDLYEVLVTSSPCIKFGLAFCEASGPRLIRTEGNDDEMQALALRAAQDVACGHTFFIFMKDAYPINVLNGVKGCPEVCRIFAATANPLSVIVAEQGDARGVLGVLDGLKPLGVEDEKAKEDRLNFLKMIGYKR